jgi:hypothetical protein
VAFSSVIGAEVRRARPKERADRPSPRGAVRRAASYAWPAARPPACPEVDCVRALLPRQVIAAAERRAQSIGLGADRVLVCADAITEEAYLTALAASLGTSYQPLDRFRRADCPLDDNQLIQAAAAGLLPLREDGRIVWIIAPRCQTASRLADPNQSPPAWLDPFRFTSSAQLWRFVARYTQNALGRQAADGLRNTQPLLSNGSRSRVWTSVIAAALLIVVVTVLALVPAATIKAFAALLCAIFLAAAALRLSSALYMRPARDRPPRIDDRELPIYTIICALYREENVGARRMPLGALSSVIIISFDDRGMQPS